MIVTKMWFADFVRNTRTKKKMTMTDLAISCGLCRQQIGNIEKDVSSPRLFTAYVILTALGCTMSDYEKFYKEKLK